jgi:hypothetical protein
MHASKYPVQSQHPQTGSGNRPLAGSVFSGEARLRELEHLAETARKVRDQAAAELTRNGSTHHIARDRIAAAERMLRKTQQEIADLRAQLGPAAQPAATPSAQQNDFELAMLLGHSKARFNQADPSQPSLELQQDSPTRDAKGGRAKHKSARAKTATGSRGSSWRTLVFGLLLGVGIGGGAIGSYAAVTTSSISDVVQEGATQIVTKLRNLWPELSSSAAGALSARNSHLANNAATQQHTTQVDLSDNPNELQEQQARAAAEQRLERQIASQGKPRT